MEVLELARIRAEIETIDNAIVSMIGQRCRLAEAAGDAHADAAAGNNGVVPPADLQGDAAVLRRAATRARAEAVDEEAVRRIFWSLIDLGRRAQRRRASW